MRVDDETVFVTGAGSGLGREACERFAEEEATVVAADVDRDGASATVERLEESGAEVRADAMLFLASDEADWITGQALVVDGGFSCV